MQHRFISLNNDRMPGIMPSLEAYNRRNLVGQQINDFTFAFKLILFLQNTHLRMWWNW